MKCDIAWIGIIRMALVTEGISVEHAIGRMNGFEHDSKAVYFRPNITKITTNDVRAYGFKHILSQ